MAQMEKIVRPHIPTSFSPPVTPAKCQVPPENVVAKVEQTASADAGGGGGQQPQKATRNSSWSHSWKTYMTKKEKEITADTGKKDKDGVVSDQKTATDDPNVASGRTGGTV